MIKAYKEEVFCAVVSEMITAQVLFISENAKDNAYVNYVLLPSTTFSLVVCI
jgi:hypothetical protein